MVDSQQQPSQSDAARALAMLQNGSKTNNNKRKLVLDFSRKRGRPKKKRQETDTLAKDVDSLTIKDPVQDAFTVIDDNSNQSYRHK